MDLQKQKFQERLNRIAKGGPNTLGQVHVGISQAAMGNGAGRMVQVSSYSHWAERALFPFWLASALLIGILSVLISRLVRFIFLESGLTGEDADILMAIDSGGALAIGLVLFWFFRLSGKAMLITKLLGIFAMICMMHNLVHVYPAPFAMMFSPDWVDDVVIFTEPNSILFRGVSFVIGDLPVPLE